MEQKAADMAEIDGVKVETLTDDKGYKAIKVTFDSGILFESGSYTLNEAAKASLSEFVEEMRDLPETNITVYGHTDNTGSAAASERVSTACKVSFRLPKITWNKAHKLFMRKIL